LKDERLRRRRSQLDQGAQQLAKRQCFGSWIGETVISASPTIAGSLPRAGRPAHGRGPNRRANSPPPSTSGGCLRKTAGTILQLQSVAAYYQACEHCGYAQRPLAAPPAASAALPPAATLVMPVFNLRCREASTMSCSRRSTASKKLLLGQMRRQLGRFTSLPGASSLPSYAAT